ncbi:M3 family metallopeptidase [Asticcacaulis sp. EMRT-3]|uniref:M3 family metallopeptidase n=1 Tax=Asticcacaulis sp. EMRT-3 TaxID=3040349 RepID=UPI0024AF747D|nr:M3 family metallopeptidase [Asticcacaulis sp. EMRT-3]MDI7776254.1 M3 family metallopeptidase [Asticcacaulis sp. EMRT-3]
MKPLSRLWLTTAVSAAAFMGSQALASTPLDKAVDAFLSQSVLTATDRATIDARCQSALDLATQAKAALEARTGPATLKDDFAAYDTLNLILGDASNELYLVSETNVSKDVRDAAEACIPRLSDLGTAVSLSRPIYDRLAAIPTKGLDDKTAFTLNHQLIEYRLAGVDKDAATRAKITELQKAITTTGLEFDAHIRDDTGDIALKPEELKGLPQDYIDAHKPGPDGLVHLTFAYPDIFPMLDFADSRAARKKVYTAFRNRGYPANDTTLKTLLQERYDLATTLGYANYAALITADKMIGSEQHAAQFLDDMNAAAAPGARADYDELLAFGKTVDPSITQLQSYDTSYLENKLRKAKYDVDAAQVRQYFTLAKTRAGIFQLMHDMFGADIRPWDTPVWAPDVTAWSIYDGQRLVGHFYLDLSPRDGKYNHAAQFPIRTGVEGRQIPVGALVTNFPATGPMDHDDVTTFLHEFGHLIHDMYSGHTRYGVQSMNNLQWDFIEAPSQLLEEWTWDYDTLKSFASDPEGHPIPEDLVKRMNEGRHFGEAIQWKGQLAYSAVSLNFYNRKPDFDLDTLYNEQMARYSLFPAVPDTHPYDSFGHLNGYSAIYYTYVWSKAIALDLFTQFQKDGMRNPQTAIRYRKDVLEPGSSQDANTLIQTFLGRPMSLEAFKKELQKQ